MLSHLGRCGSENDRFSLQYKGRAFKIASLDRWMVILPGEELVDELRRLPEHIMSGRAAGNEV